MKRGKPIVVDLDALEDAADIIEHVDGCHFRNLSHVLKVHCDPRLLELVDRFSCSQMITPGAFVRQAIISALDAAGIAVPADIKSQPTHKPRSTALRLTRNRPRKSQRKR